MSRAGILKNIIDLIYRSRWELALFSIIMAVMYLPVLTADRDGMRSVSVPVTLLLLIAGGCVTIVMRAGEKASESWSDAGHKGRAVLAGAAICLIAALLAAGIYQAAVVPIDPQPVITAQQSAEEEATPDDPEELEYYGDEETAQGGEEEDPFSDWTEDRESAAESGYLKTVAAPALAAVIIAVVMRRRARRAAMRISKRISAGRRQREIARAGGSRQVVLAFRDICEQLAEKGIRRPPSMTAAEFAIAVNDHFENDGADLLQTAELYEKVMYGGYEPSEEECEKVLRDRKRIRNAHP